MPDVLCVVQTSLLSFTTESTCGGVLCNLQWVMHGQTTEVQVIHEWRVRWAQHSGTPWKPFPNDFAWHDDFQSRPVCQIFWKRLEGGKILSSSPRHKLALDLSRRFSWNVDMQPQISFYTLHLAIHFWHPMQWSRTVGWNTLKGIRWVSLFLKTV